MKQWEIDILSDSVHSAAIGPIIGLIETHISWVILTELYAYKIKKPVKFSFLDFSTLKKRKHFCQRELELNRRLTANMYLAVVPVFKQEGMISFDPPGNIADYAVVMKRMNSDIQMDKLVQLDKVTPIAVTSLAKKISDFHQTAEIIYGKFDIRSLQKRFNDLEGIDYKEDKNVARIIGRAINYSDNFLNRYENIFIQREQEGWIRDIHGDLHTKNIFLYHDPVIFDCIEFNDDMRRIDILDEVAFLCMDLESCGREDLSNLFYKRYVALSGIPITKTTELIFRYFKLYRANIRAKVAMITAQNDLEKNQHVPPISDASRYLDLMRNYINDKEKQFKIL